VYVAGLAIQNGRGEGRSRMLRVCDWRSTECTSTSAGITWLCVRKMASYDMLRPPPMSALPDVAERRGSDRDGVMNCRTTWERAAADLAVNRGLNRNRVAHIDVDARVVLRRGHADAFEYPHRDPDLRDAAFVHEHRIAAAGHRRI
jgi:hypothetical protein